MKKLDPVYGDELIREKGGDPYYYLSSICYHYPWVPFRLTVNVSEDYKASDDAEYKIFRRKSRALIGEGAFKEPYIIECLLPDSRDIVVYADGMEILTASEHPIVVEDEEVGEGEIKEMYWSYKNEVDEYVRINDEDLSRHYVDLCLVVDTDGMANGKEVKVTINTVCEAGNPVKLDVSGIVNDNKAVIENVFEKQEIL